MRYKQCTLQLEVTYSEYGAICPIRELVEWVPSDIAICGKIVSCLVAHWRIVHVGQEHDDPRDAHTSPKAFPSIQVERSRGNRKAEVLDESGW